MTQAVFGGHIDIHSGGVDLKFPHHTNEIAQSESYNKCEPNAWCSQWIHTGHMYIDGLKMSKSLKNFILIKDFLSNNEYSSQPGRDLRIYLLQHKYSSALHFSKERIHEASVYRQRVDNFLAMVSTLELNNHRRCKYNPNGHSLLQDLYEAKSKVMEALKDDINTPLALGIVSDLIGKASAYIHQFAATHNPIEPLLEVKSFVADFFQKLGVLSEASKVEVVKVMKKLLIAPRT